MLLLIYLCWIWPDFTMSQVITNVNRLLCPGNSTTDCLHVSWFCACDVQDIAQEAVKKRRRATKKPYSRSIVGATLEVIQKKRTEKPEVRDAAREAALRCVSSCFCWLFECSFFMPFLVTCFHIFLTSITYDITLWGHLWYTTYSYKLLIFCLQIWTALSNYLILRCRAVKLKRGSRKRRMRRRQRKQK